MRDTTSGKKKKSGPQSSSAKQGSSANKLHRASAASNETGIVPPHRKLASKGSNAEWILGSEDQIATVSQQVNKQGSQLQSIQRMASLQQSSFSNRNQNATGDVRSNRSSNVASQSHKMLLTHSKAAAQNN